jgi:hypothetical protein
MALDLDAEFRAVVGALDREGLEYAVVQLRELDR